MLNAVAVNDCLSSAVGNGIVTVILLGNDGVPLSSASSTPEYDHSRERAMIVAAIGNVWRASARNDLSRNKTTNELEPDALEHVLIDFGQQKICAISVGGGAILCVVSRGLEMGLLKLKAVALQQRLDAYLRPVLAMLYR
ncbi:hypothetical protein ERJ75_001740500 [Trypanosoma vivax]|uniref:Roadblock/LAMTOR2 domain-containing protein n=1 Tax=Trypanosoma vivax (strain Y486) TaxID=1055687 RepID=G0U2W8_TRYVY|nr:hypothetical protein TRVL_00898 [Trypanosoma vivax]KAH8604098.1 hypothetical protein ERJ75_001740500 [Trypanosoma vivax]CCC50622.1 conserved hypothetical protein [Trypanosoma vivax Y486]